MGAWDKDRRDIEYCPSCGAYIPSKAVRCLSCGAVTERGKQYWKSKRNPITGTVTKDGIERDTKGNVLSVPDEEQKHNSLFAYMTEEEKRRFEQLRKQRIEEAIREVVDLDLDDIRQKQFFTVKIGGKVRTMYIASPLCSSPHVVESVTFGSWKNETAKLRLNLTFIER